MKKTLATLLALIMALVMLPSIALAEGESSVTLPDGITANSFTDNKTVYYSEEYYTSINDAIAAAKNDAIAAAKNKSADKSADDAALIYCKPGATVPIKGTDTNDHIGLTTSITIYGNGATLDGGWEPDIGFYFSQTKGVAITIKNLGKAGIWGTMSSDHDVEVNFEDCQNVHGVLLQYGSGEGRAFTTVKNCTFERGSNGNVCGVVGVKQDFGGTLLVEDCTFEKIPAGVNCKNDAGDLNVTIKGCKFIDCSIASVCSDEEKAYAAPIRRGAETDASGTVTISDCTFTYSENSKPLNGADIIIGENRTGNDGSGTISMVDISSTNGEVKVFAPHVENVSGVSKALTVSKSKTIKASVAEILAPDITLNHSELGMAVGGTATLEATGEDGQEVNNLTWTSSDETVSVVANGTVTAKAAGKATITARTDYKSATCVVTVAAADAAVPAVKEAAASVENITIAGAGASEQTAMETSAKSTAESVKADNTLAREAENTASSLTKTEQSKLKDAATSLQSGDLTLYAQTYLDVKGTSVEVKDNAIASITLEITPMVQIVASTAKNAAAVDTAKDSNAVVVQEASALTVDEPAEVTVKLPSNFGSETVYIKHDKNNTSYYYKAEAASDGTLTFTSKHGFSPFTFSLVNGAKVEDDNGVGYDDLQTAVNAATDGAKITVLDGGTSNTLTATMSGASRKITVKNGTNNSITVTIGGETKTIAKEQSATFTYTAPVTPDTPVVPVTPSYSSSSSSSGNTYSWYFNPTPTPTPVPVMVAPAVALPKTGDMTIFQSILAFLGII